MDPSGKLIAKSDNTLNNKSSSTTWAEYSTSDCTACGMDNFATSNTGYCIKTNNIQPRSTKPKCNPFHKFIIGIRGWVCDWPEFPSSKSKTNSVLVTSPKQICEMINMPCPSSICRRDDQKMRGRSPTNRHSMPSRHSWSNRLTTTTISVRIRHLHRSSPLTLNQNGYRCFARGKIRTWGKWGKIIYVLKTFTSEINRDRTPPSP